jgi:hypothetical protein
MEERTKDVSLVRCDPKPQSKTYQREGAQSPANKKQLQRAKPTKTPNIAITRSGRTTSEQLRSKRKVNDQHSYKVKRLQKQTLKEIPPIYNCKFPLIEIYQTFTNRSSSDNSNRLWLLTRLFFAVASQDAFVQLRNSCLTIRESISTVILSSSNTVSANMESLDQLDVSLATAFVVKRFHLIRLVEARM